MTPSNLETTTHKDDRNWGHWLPDIWGDLFTSFSLNTQLFESYDKEVRELAEEVKEMLVAAGHGSKYSEKLIFINTLERLGVSYLFQKEIEEQLEQIVNKFEGGDYDLFTVALCFRIFRQHGYEISCNIFNKFVDDKGNLKEAVMKNAKGMLSLYDATFVMINGEDILERVQSLTKKHLESMLPNLSPGLALQVNRALEQPLHRGVRRVEASYYISEYEQDDAKNEKLMRLAKVDFNRVQLLHKEEIRQISLWWKEIISEAPYARDRIVEYYMWSTAVLFEPEYAYSRVLLAKVIALLTIIDDAYDAYGLYEELKFYTQAIQRWDRSDMDQLPSYLKMPFRAVLDFHDEMEKELEKQGSLLGLHYSKEAFKEIVKTYDTETEWVRKKYVPSFDEYLSYEAKISTGIVATTSFVGMGETATAEAFEWIRLGTTEKVAIDSAIIGRLKNDIAGYQKEQERKHGAAAVQCYMDQYNVTEDKAIHEMHKIIDNAWKNLNEGFTRRPATISMPIFMTLLNHTRVFSLFYKVYDRLTNPDGLKEEVLALFVNPILL